MLFFIGPRCCFCRAKVFVVVFVGPRCCFYRAKVLFL